MNYEELFIESNNLPKPLSDKELYSYLEQYRLYGDKFAKEQVIIHNIRLVLNRVSKRFAYTPYEQKDLVSIGIIGLIKSINNFDIKKNIEFSTFATRCIDNEILLYFRRSKKSTSDISMNAPIAVDGEGNEKRIEDILEDKTSDFVSDYENSIVYNEIRKIVYSFSGRDREIILLRFGFIDDHPYTLKKIADIFEVTESYASRLVTKTLKRIAAQLYKKGMIETVGIYGKNTRPTSTELSKNQILSNTYTIDDKSIVESEEATVIIANEKERKLIKNYHPEK